MIGGGVAIIIAIVKGIRSRDITPMNEIHDVMRHASDNRPTPPSANSLTNCGIRFGESFFTKVVGVTYNGVQGILPTLRAGMPLRFVREPHNQYDKNAIAIKCNGMNIGHLSADVAKDVAPLMDSGAQVEGEISKITGGNGKTYGCNIEVTIYK